MLDKICKVYYTKIAKRALQSKKGGSGYQDTYPRAEKGEKALPGRTGAGGGHHIRTTTSGINMARFRIACDRNFARQGEQRQADFLDVVAWRSQADFVCKYFQKGSLIVIDGSIQTRQYQDKNGNNRTAVEIVANNINFAGPKNSSGSNGGGASYGSQPRQNAQPAARPSNIEAVPSYSAGDTDDFAVIDDSDDLPF